MAQPAAFGLNVDPNAGGLAIAGRITAIADSAGLEYVGVQDHPYNAEFLDTFTVITWLAARGGGRGPAPDASPGPGMRRSDAATRSRAERPSPAAAAAPGISPPARRRGAGG